MEFFLTSLDNSFLMMIKEFKPKKSPRWLPKTYSAAFVVCLGAGPWRYNRRRHIQGLALDKIKKVDLRYLKVKQCNFYPLKWQNDILVKMVLFLRKNNTTFKDFCKKVIEKNSIDLFYKACEKNNHIKTISLFCRDKLKIDSFPIDRHVAKNLKKYNLPINEQIMIDLCRKNNLNPIKVSYSLVSRNLDKGNPNWSKYNVKSGNCSTQ